MVKKLTRKEIAERMAFFRERLDACGSEFKNSLRLNELEDWVSRLIDEIVENIYGDKDAHIQKAEQKNEIFASAEDAQDAILKEVNQQLPTPLQIDEVAYAYFNDERVRYFEILGENYGGHKTGAIYSFVLELIEKHIGESTNLSEITPGSVIFCPKGHHVDSKGEIVTDGIIGGM